MIERQFINQKLKEYHIRRYLESHFTKTGYSHTDIKRTPLGEKIVIFTTKPGIIIGKKGENIQKLTQTLKKKFKMANPQIEIGEMTREMLDVHYVADRLVSTLEKFGSQRFKSIGYKMLQGIMDAGAVGAEIVISGKVPSARAKRWRFSAGYLKKSGDIAENYVKKAYSSAKLKPGIIGVQVRIMMPETKIPDTIILKNPEQEKITESKPKEKIDEKQTTGELSEKTEKEIEEETKAK